jgi:hypothetical protein
MRAHWTPISERHLWHLYGPILDNTNVLGEPVPPEKVFLRLGPSEPMDSTAQRLTNEKGQDVERKSCKAKWDAEQEPKRDAENDWGVDGHKPRE